ncbi:MAG: hypothetical protein JXA66_03310 [Oligoflexia bacterium]|nr:hypothetical protein [Oligoflexia bacterium]
MHYFYAAFIAVTLIWIFGKNRKINIVTTTCMFVFFIIEYYLIGGDFYSIYLAFLFYLFLSYFDFSTRISVDYGKFPYAIPLVYVIFLILHDKPRQTPESTDSIIHIVLLSAVTVLIGGITVLFALSRTRGGSIDD